MWFCIRFSILAAMLALVPGASIRPWTAGVNHTILFNGDLLNVSLANKLSFDSTPGDRGTDKAFADWDALTVMRHEIGHMLGFTDLYRDNFNLCDDSKAIQI